MLANFENLNLETMKVVGKKWSGFACPPHSVWLVLCFFDWILPFEAHSEKVIADPKNANMLIAPCIINPTDRLEALESSQTQVLNCIRWLGF